MLIDMHCHYLPGVDDGFKEENIALSRLQEAYAAGVEAFVFTPHFYHHHYHASRAHIDEAFARLSSRAKELGVNAQFYLGREIHWSKNIDVISLLDEHKIQTLGNTNWVLLEFSTDEMPEESLSEILYRFDLHGYRVIIAHVERYRWMSHSIASLLIEEGAYLQVNADDLMGKNGFYVKALCRRLLKKGLVSFIASDTHSFRGGCLKEAFKKYGSYLRPCSFEEDLKKANP